MQIARDERRRGGAPARLDRLDMGGPGVDERHVVPGRSQPGPNIAADRAGADDRDPMGHAASLDGAPSVGQDRSAGNQRLAPAIDTAPRRHPASRPNVRRPTLYGIQGACALLGCDHQWTGSMTSNAGEMVNAMDTPVAGKADAIAVSLVDQQAFVRPIRAARPG